MMTIHKYRLEPGLRMTVDMPKGAVILSVQPQHEVACLWALVDPDAPLQPRPFRLVMTGEPLGDTGDLTLDFIGTVQLLGGGFVLHVFEERRP